MCGGVPSDRRPAGPGSSSAVPPVDPAEQFGADVPGRPARRAPARRQENRIHQLLAEILEDAVRSTRSRLPVPGLSRRVIARARIECPALWATFALLKPPAGTK